MNTTHLSLEELKLLEDSVVHAQLGVPHQNSVPVLSANTVRQVAQVLFDGVQPEITSGNDCQFKRNNGSNRHFIEHKSV